MDYVVIGGSIAIGAGVLAWAGWQVRKAPEGDSLDWAAPRDLSPPVAEEPALPSLTPDEIAVLMEMSGELGHAALRIAQWTGLKVETVRQVHRNLRAKGLADFGHLTSVEGKFGGRGYWLNGDGLRAKARLDAVGQAVAA